MKKMMFLVVGMAAFAMANLVNANDTSCATECCEGVENCCSIQNICCGGSNASITSTKPNNEG